MKYPQQFDGDRVRPVMRSYRMLCCDCAKVHVFNFYIVRHKGRLMVEFKVWENRRATAAARRERNNKKVVARRPSAVRKSQP